jgi:Family of unknown function (DUF5519)
MSVTGAAEKIRKAVAAWPETVEAPHQFGAVEFRIGEREIGHLHGDRLLDVPFPRAVHDELIGAGLAELHHILPQSGWVSFRIKTPADVDATIALLRRSYDLIKGQLARGAKQSAAAKSA